MPLSPPAVDFVTLTLPTRKVRVDKLRRISGHDTGEPYFGKRGVYRFDDPAKGFGTCYCGLELDTALAESLLHDQVPVNGVFDVAQSMLDSKYVVKFAAPTAGATLTLADLTGHALKRLGGDNAISSDHPYDVPQQWAVAVHAHPAHVDGIIFVSRQLNTKRAVVVFDRAAGKFGPATYTRLGTLRALAAAKVRLGIQVVFP